MGPNPYRVVDRHGNNVYFVERLDGDGVQKSVHRSEMPDSKLLAGVIHPVNRRVEEDRLGDDGSNSDEGSDDEGPFDIIIPRNPATQIISAESDGNEEEGCGCLAAEDERI